MNYTFDEEIISDLHKDAYGFRPKESFWHNWSAMSDDEKQATWDRVSRDLDNELQNEVKRNEASLLSFVGELNDIIGLGAKSNKQAVKIFLQSRDLDESDYQYGADYILYTLGLEASTAEEFPIQDAIDEILDEIAATRPGM